MQTFGQHLKNLLQVQTTLPANSALRAFIDQIADTVGDVLNVIQPIPQNEAKDSYAGATPNKTFISQANVAYLDAAMNVAITNAPKYGLDPQKLQALIEDVTSLDTRIQLQKQPSVQKATTAAIKGIQLNTRGEFVINDREIRKSADSFAERFGLKKIWARNLIGMFGIDVSYEDRRKFMAACESGEALDVSAMISKGQGPLEDVVTTKIPGLKDVFKSIKETLLDISLSTGQRGATGPFEALVAIMGGGRKPAQQEGGDIIIKNKGKDVKLELKAGSITIKAATGKVGGLSSAWLDSTAGGEISPSKLRSVANEWLEENFPLALKNAQLAGLWKQADFRPSMIDNFSNFLLMIEKKKPGVSNAFIGGMMATMFPSITNVPGYDFKKAVKNIVYNIAKKDCEAIAKEQGIMALLEYIAGKGNDGFLLFNGSTQEYKMIMGVEGVLNLYKSNDVNPDSSLVRFKDTMTMLVKTTKCSPSIYFGPSNTSNRAKEYAKNFMSDPERVALRANAEAAGDHELPDSESAWEDTPEPVAQNTQPRARRSVAQTPIRQKR